VVKAVIENLRLIYEEINESDPLIFPNDWCGRLSRFSHTECNISKLTRGIITLMMYVGANVINLSVLAEPVTKYE
jgi:hypothetical protein